MSVLVTGASGFVGAAVVRRLIADGHDDVRVLVRPTSDRAAIKTLPVDIFLGDVTDRRSLRAPLKKCRAVYHVAADYRLWTRDPASMFRTNVDGTRNMLLAAADAGADRIVYTSSVATLGLPRDGTEGDETTPVSYDDMIGPYKQSKFLAEEEARTLARDESVPVVIVNPSLPVGPGDVRPTPTGRMVLQAASGRMPAYVDTGLNVVHVDDVAEGHLLACRNGEIGARYVLGGQNMTLHHILTAIAAIVGGRPPSFSIPHNAVLPVAYMAEAWTWLTGGTEPFVSVDGVKLAKKHMYFSWAKAAEHLGYAPRPAEIGLRNAIVWYRENGYLKS